MAISLRAAGLGMANAAVTATSQDEEEGRIPYLGIEKGKYGGYGDGTDGGLAP